MFFLTSMTNLERTGVLPLKPLLSWWRRKTTIIKTTISKTIIFLLTVFLCFYMKLRKKTASATILLLAVFQYWISCIWQFHEFFFYYLCLMRLAPEAELSRCDFRVICMVVYQAWRNLFIALKNLFDKHNITFENK